MKKHLLLEKAYIYPLERDEANLSDYLYDTEKGYWLNKETQGAFILEPSARRPQSKKCDRETGEDQKGE